MRIALSRVLRSLLSHKASIPPSSVFATSSSHFLPARDLSTMSTRARDFEFNRQELEELLRRRFFISRAFDIYGGVAGLFDLGVCHFCFDSEI
jgi:hypothetical protein